MTGYKAAIQLQTLQDAFYFLYPFQSGFRPNYLNKTSFMINVNNFLTIIQQQDTVDTSRPLSALDISDDQTMQDYWPDLVGHDALP